MQDPKITHFPVGNGDCSLIILSDNTQILIDCNTTEDASDDSVDERYDVHGYLLKYGKKHDGKIKIPHIDAFILTHADQDHCRGFETMFYTGDPAAYSAKHEQQGLLLIDELWFTPRIFCPHDTEMCKPAQAFRKEALRRMDLHKKLSPERNNRGNRLRIVGYTDNPDRKGLDHLTSVPGTYVDVIDGKKKTDFRFFIHAPFKLESDSKWSERNDTSLVLQARFDVDGTPDAAFAIFGGDAGAAIWEKILQRSGDESTLQWDLFLAPHHCSWTFFSEQPYKDNKTPAKSSLAILGKAMNGARIVASCKPIRDDDDNPPHWAAAQLYKKAVGAQRFHVTSETPSEKRPLPIEFSISENGPVLEESPAASAVASSAAMRTAVSTPQTYGRH
jgi:hypothetical protein